MNIIEYIKRLLGIDTSVDKITRPITSIVAKLDAYEAQQIAKADKARADADARLKVASAANSAALNASATRQKFASIFSE